MVSKLKDTDGPSVSVIGIMISPASGMVVSNPSWMPAGAAIWVVNHGLPRWMIWWATHCRSQT